MCTDHLFANPQTPSTAFLDATSALIESRVAAAQQAQTEQELVLNSYPQQSAVWEAVGKGVTDIRKDLDFIVEDLHAHPELAFQEVRSKGACRCGGKAWA